MRVAYLVNQYPKGSHTFIRREIAALEALGVTIDRFSIRRTAETLTDLADQAEQRCTRVIFDAGWRGWLVALAKVAWQRPAPFVHALALAGRMGRRSDRGLARYLAYLAEAAVLVGWLAPLGVDHVHAHFATNPAAVALLCHALGGPPYSFTAHGPDDFDRAPWLALNVKIARAAFVTSVSHYGRSQLYRWCDPRDWSRIHVVRAGLDDAFLGAPATPIPSAPRLVCVGRLCVEKGQCLLIDAVHRLAQGGIACEVVIVGDGPLRAVLAERVARLGLTDRVRLVGWASGVQVRAHVLAARALVLPSLAENLPSVLTEALALGRPVISTTIAGIPELVTPGVNGWLVPPGDVEALTAALREALDAPVAQLEAMGQVGADKVRGEFDARRSAEALLGLFQAGALR